jgi:hemolysin activation/secretion protein
LRIANFCLLGAAEKLQNAVDRTEVFTPAWRLVGCAATIWLITASLSFAVDPAGSVQKHLEDEEQRRQIRKEIQRRLSTDRPGKSIDDSAIRSEVGNGGPATDAASFACRRIVFDESEVLNPGWLAEVARPYEGREVTVGELKSLVARINDVYHEKGLATARAVLPSQEVVDGLVRIALIEGKVGQVRLQGNRHTCDSVIRQNLPSLASTGQLLDTRQLAQDLIRYNKLHNNDLRVELKPGAGYEETEVLVVADDKKLWRAAFMSDNLGQTSVGEYRQSVLLEANSLSGYRDALTMTGTFADGTNSVYGSYLYPVVNRNVEVGVIGSYSDIAVRHGAFKDLGIKGYSHDLGGIVAFPVRVDERWLVKTNVQLHHKYSNSFVTGFAISNCDEYVSSHGFTVEKTDERGIWYGQFDQYLGSDTESEQRAFYKLTGGLARVQFIPDTPWMAIFRVSGQASATRLPTLEKFQIGGGTTVRGFPEVLLIGDDGYLTSIELSAPMRWLPCQIGRIPVRDRFRGFGFVDHGGAFNRDDTGLLPELLLSAGAGVSLQVDDRINGHCTIGFPIGNYDHVPGVGDYRIHFSFTMAY